MTAQEMEALKKCSWATLARMAVEVDVPTSKIREAATRDELRLLIIDATIASRAIA